MKINKAWCFFEQSGIFKNEFKKLGIPAVDCDILNNFNQTDFELDLFREKERRKDHRIPRNNKILAKKINECRI